MLAHAYCIIGLKFRCLRAQDVNLPAALLPVLTEFATEVSKIINAAVKGMEADVGGAKDSIFC